jgi:hypothetical protein
VALPKIISEKESVIGRHPFNIGGLTKKTADGDGEEVVRLPRTRPARLAEGHDRAEEGCEPRYWAAEFLYTICYCPPWLFSLDESIAFSIKIGKEGRLSPYANGLVLDKTRVLCGQAKLIED